MGIKPACQLNGASLHRHLKIGSPKGKEITTLDEMQTQMFCVSVQLAGCNSFLSSVAWLLLCCTIQKNDPKKQQFPSTLFSLLNFQDSLAYFHYPVSPWTSAIWSTLLLWHILASVLCFSYDFSCMYTCIHTGLTAALVPFHFLNFIKD